MCLDRHAGASQSTESADETDTDATTSDDGDGESSSDGESSDYDDMPELEEGAMSQCLNIVLFYVFNVLAGVGALSAL